MDGYKPCPLCGSTIPDEPNELDDLRAEVARLRAEVADQRTRADSLALAYREEQGRNTTIQIEAERHRRIVDQAVTRIKSAEAERAAVVDWLRGEPERLVECDGRRHADGKPCLVMSPMPADELADCIERGEHRRKEKTP
jgi:hypothetical protein